MSLARRFPGLEPLEPEAARLFELCARLARVPGGTHRVHPGAPRAPDRLVVAGSVRVRKIGESGREIVLYRVESGQACVLTTNGLITARDYDADGIAETEVEMVVLPQPVFHRLLGESAVFRAFVFSAYAIRLSDLLTLIEAVAFGRVDVRLAAWLATRAGADGAILATHQDLSLIHISQGIVR